MRIGKSDPSSLFELRRGKHSEVGNEGYRRQFKGKSGHKAEKWFQVSGVRNSKQFNFEMGMKHRTETVEPEI